MNLNCFVLCVSLFWYLCFKTSAVRVLTPALSRSKKDPELLSNKCLVTFHLLEQQTVHFAIVKQTVCWTGWTTELQRQAAGREDGGRAGGVWSQEQRRSAGTRVCGLCSVTWGAPSEFTGVSWTNTEQRLQGRARPSVDKTADWMISHRRRAPFHFLTFFKKPGAVRYVWRHAESWNWCLKSKNKDGFGEKVKREGEEKRVLKMDGWTRGSFRSKFGKFSV